MPYFNGDGAMRLSRWWRRGGRRRITPLCVVRRGMIPKPLLLRCSRSWGTRGRPRLRKHTVNAAHLAMVVASTNAKSGGERAKKASSGVGFVRAPSCMLYAPVCSATLGIHQLRESSAETWRAACWCFTVLSLPASAGSLTSRLFV